MFVVLCCCCRGRGVRRKQKFGDFSDWVNVFKPGTGTITVYENSGRTRGPQLFQLKGIPLTPGPLVVVIKVASSVVKEPDKCVQHHGDPYGLFGCSARSETCLLRLCFVLCLRWLLPLLVGPAGTGRRRCPMRSRPSQRASNYRLTIKRTPTTQ
jgi:hypothetical protein